jgi:uncharacterized protein (TIGR04255 family)
VIPKKLNDDSIIEALCQVQFASQDLPEVVIGRLSDFSDAGSYQQTRLPFADIPESVRRVTPNLRSQPLMQLVRQDGRIVQIGERVLSAHVVGAGKYPGWGVFRSHLSEVFARLFEKVKNVEVEGITLRYINALVLSRHFIAGPHYLNIGVSIAGEKFDGPVNLNFVDRPNDVHAVTTRIADTRFVMGGPLPEGTTAVVDVEVTTGNRISARALGDVLGWIDTAHTLEKMAFFKLLPPDVIRKLTKE